MTIKNELGTFSTRQDSSHGNIEVNQTYFKIGCDQVGIIFFFWNLSLRLQSHLERKTYIRWKKTTLVRNNKHCQWNIF